MNSDSTSPLPPNLQNYEDPPSPSSYSDSSNPPHLRWAEGLDILLEDRDGVNKFYQYLQEEEQSKNLLDFWFACKGLHASDSRELAEHLVDTIYKHFIKWNSTVYYIHSLHKECRQNLLKQWRERKNFDIEQLKAIYDEALAEVTDLLVIKHAAFIGSEHYLRLLREEQDLERNATCELLNSNDANTVCCEESGTCLQIQSTQLPTVHEEEEWCPSKLSQLTITNLVATADQRAQAQPVLMVPSSSVSVPSASGTEMCTAATSVPIGVASAANPSAPPNPYHTNYVPHLPCSAQDSEIQSSDADTNISWSDKSENFFAWQSNKKQQRRADEMIRRNAVQNRASADLKMVQVPRTAKPGSGCPLIDPTTDINRFAEELNRKLCHVIQEQEEENRLNQSLRQLSEPESSNNREKRREAVMSFFNNKLTCAMETPVASGVGLLPEQEASSILDEHVRRTWDTPPRQSPQVRSPGYFRRRSPKRSPGSKSPDRRVHFNSISSMRMNSSFPGPHFLTNQISPPALLRSVIESTTSASVNSPSAAMNSSRHKLGRSQNANTPSALGSSVDAGRRFGTPYRNNSRLAPTGPSVTQRRPPPPSDTTSGISSGGSSGNSLVCAQQNSTSVKAAQSHKQTSSSHRSATAEKPRKATAAQEVANLSNQTSRRSGSGSGHSSGSPSINSTGVVSAAPLTAVEQILTVVYFMGEEDTPYTTKFNRTSMNLKQFKAAIARKGLFKYFFKMASDVTEKGVVWNEVHDEQELLPIWDGKVVARIVPVEDGPVARSSTS